MKELAAKRKITSSSQTFQRHRKHPSPIKDQCRLANHPHAVPCKLYKGRFCIPVKIRLHEDVSISGLSRLPTSFLQTYWFLQLTRTQSYTQMSSSG